MEQQVFLGLNLGDRFCQKLLHMVVCSIMQTTTIHGARRFPDGVSSARTLCRRRIIHNHGGGGGGGVAHTSSATLTPGSTMTVIVGQGGQATSTTSDGGDGRNLTLSICQLDGNDGTIDGVAVVAPQTVAQVEQVRPTAVVEEQTMVLAAVAPVLTAIHFSTLVETVVCDEVISRVTPWSCTTNGGGGGDANGDWSGAGNGG